jgi:hypothetical protein
MAPWFPACRPKKNDNFSQKNWAEKKAGANGRVNPRIHYTSVPADSPPALPSLQYSISPVS